MKLTIEIELDDYTDLLGMLAKNGKKKLKLAAVEPALWNGQPSGEDIPRVPDNWNARKGALRLRAGCQTHNSG